MARHGWQCWVRVLGVAWEAVLGSSNNAIYEGERRFWIQSKLFSQHLTEKPGPGVTGMSNRNFSSLDFPERASRAPGKKYCHKCAKTLKTKPPKGQLLLCFDRVSGWRRRNDNGGRVCYRSVPSTSAYVMHSSSVPSWGEARNPRPQQRPKSAGTQQRPKSAGPAPSSRFKERLHKVQEQAASIAHATPMTGVTVADEQAHKRMPLQLESDARMAVERLTTDRVEELRRSVEGQARVHNAEKLRGERKLQQARELTAELQVRQPEP